MGEGPPGSFHAGGGFVALTGTGLLGMLPPHAADSELLAERGIEVDHVTVHRWVQRFTPLLVDAARFGRHRVGDRWHVDETYVKVAGRWLYLYRAVDQFGHVYASTRRDGEAARRFFQQARTSTGVAPVEVVTDRAPTYPRVLDELWPTAWHCVERYANNRVEADHAQLKRRLRAMRGIKTMTGLRIFAAGHAFVQNLRRGHYEIATDQARNLRPAIAFGQLATAV
jgi:IS6 family transposase